MTEELEFTKTITSGEVSRMVTRVLGRNALNVEVGGSRIRIQFDPPATHEEIQLLDQRLSKMGYYLLERD